MDEIQSNHMRGKNAVCILYDSVYMISGKMQKKIYNDRKQISGCLGGESRGEVGDWDYSEVHGNFEVMGMLCILGLWLRFHGCIHVKTYQILHLQYMWFIIL